MYVNSKYSLTEEYYLISKIKPQIIISSYLFTKYILLT